MERIDEAVSRSAGASLRDRQRDAIRHDLRTAALKLFKDRGFAATTVDDIAREAGVSRSTFFRYFGSKTAVVVDTTDESATAFMRCLSERPRSEKPMESLENALIGMNEALRTDERRDELLLLWDIATNEPVLAAAIEARSAYFESEVARCLAERRGRSEPSLEDALASALIGPITQQIGASWAAGGDDGVADLIRDHFRAVRRLTAG